MSGAALAFESAAALGRAFAARERSVVEVVRALLERIERHDPALRCFITVTPERALADAAAADRELAAGRRRGPLHGVPVALKDLLDTAEVRTTAGSRILADHVPARDATVVARLREAGLVSLGKLNLHEFAYGTTNDNPHWGACRNPWNVERVSGGSSGGSGAGLAAGLFPLALGTDTGGSIRIPSACCGIVGLKPTFGRVSRDGVWPLAWTLDTVGPMARTVEDAALLLAAIAGEDPADPWSARSPAAAPAADRGDGLRGLRVGRLRDDVFAPEEEGVAAAVDEATRTLERLGARVRDVRWGGLEHAYTAFHTLLATEASAVHRPWMASRPHDYAPATRAALELGYAIPAVDYVNARRHQQRVRDGFDAVLAELDVVIAPTLPRTAAPVGSAPSREPGSAWNRGVVPFNLAGAPAVSLPCGFDGDGLPVGLQIAGRPWDEPTVLAVAAAYERATEWRLRRPPGFD